MPDDLADFDSPIEDEGELSQEVLDRITLAMMELVEDGRAIACGICDDYIDTRFLVAHADSHVQD